MVIYGAFFLLVFTARVLWVVGGPRTPLSHHVAPQPARERSGMGVFQPTGALTRQTFILAGIVLSAHTLLLPSG